ncbi:uncharacterized protein N7477_007504 [Penicillium maclennaniae]|uniref:uncharacterized protein n=1 Tax=Penicillium maclennaniae TaxID=1343394 RepID=UPI0025409193|nr:uncharacterized protein N7477_007504 [Penicillium maclennaniae]KAJ5665056.1 hypothetical protein N7477_007504 [Penicillium maclennaniae]
MEIAWHNIDPSRHYQFTDEPGYFCPSSPIISRQEIEEGIEDEITHACTMLVHDINQELPILPSLDTAPGPGSGSASMARASSEIHPEIQDEVTDVSPQMTAAKEFAACKPVHDSGVAFSAQSSRWGQPGQDSISGTGASARAGRFYGRCNPPQEQNETGRQRGRSVATEAKSLRSRSRSRASSFDMFPYSPPQSSAPWSHNIKRDLAPSADLFPEPESLLGAEGMAWLHASDDMHRLGDKISSSHGDEHVGLTSLLHSGPGPRRFYSTRQLPSEKAFGPHESSYELHGNLSVRSLSFDRDLHNPHSTQTYNTQPLYSFVLAPGANEPPRHKRKRASELFKKLAGLGMRRKDDPVDCRSPMVAAV